MAERKYTGTDAELLRIKRRGLSLRAIAAEVGIGKSVVGARIARAEAAERRSAQSAASARADDEGLREATATQPSTASDQTSPNASMSARSSGKGASLASSSDPHAAGPINIRAELEAIARDPKTPSREKLAALKELARIDAEQEAPSGRVRLPGPPTNSVAISRESDGRFSIWIRKPNRWVQEPGTPPAVVLYVVAAGLFGPQVLHPEAETFEDAYARLRESEPEEKPESESDESASIRD